MRFESSLWVGAMCLAIVRTVTAAELVLAEKGKTDYQIVVPATNPAPEVGARLQQIARLIQTAFKTNGFDIQVVTEDALDRTKPGLYLGDTVFARSNGVETATFVDWTYVHKVVGRDLIVAGHDQPEGAKPDPKRPQRTRGCWLGTLKGGADFLRQYAGTRFVYPGETGIEFLKVSSIAVPADLSVRKVPPLRYNTSGTSFDLVYEVANNMFPMVGLHFATHTWPYAIPAEAYRESHPEYFALINGRRCCETKSHTGKWQEQYCLSNPHVQELIYQDVLHWLDEGYAMADLGQPDGFQPCQCEPCRALYGTGDDWGEKIWIFHRTLAERLAKDRPGKRVSILAYGQTQALPRTFTRFPANATLMLVGYSESMLARWNTLDVPGGFATFTSGWGPYGVAALTPKVTPRQAASTALLFCTNHLQGFFRDNGGKGFGLEAPSYYVFGRLLDDPSALRAKEFLDEFCGGAFGETKPWMSIFFDTLYHRLELFSAGTAYDDLEGKKRQVLTDPIHYLGCIYTPDLMSSLNSLLSQAEQKAYSAKVKRRLALVRMDFEYVRKVARIVGLYNAFQMQPERGSRTRVLDALDEFRAWTALCIKQGLSDWPELPAFGGLPPGWINLQGMTYSRYKETVFGWDTQALRDAPLPGVTAMTITPVQGTVGLDSPAWAKAGEQVLKDLAGTRLPSPGKTSVRGLYDRERLYLRIESELGGAETNVPPVGRDGDVAKQESLDVCLAPFSGQDKFYHFIVGLRAVARYDAARGFIADPVDPRYGQDDPAWNGDWTYATSISADGKRWRALLTFPFKALGVTSPEPGTVWSGNVGRHHYSSANPVERSAWSVQPGLKDIPDRNSFGDIVFGK